MLYEIILIEGKTQFSLPKFFKTTYFSKSKAIKVAESTDGFLDGKIGVINKITKKLVYLCE